MIAMLAGSVSDRAEPVAADEASEAADQQPPTCHPAGAAAGIGTSSQRALLTEGARHQIARGQQLLSFIGDPNFGGLG
jgi:hypothetical protein